MNILVVGDHPITVEGYINSISQIPPRLNLLIFTKAYNCEQAYHCLMKTKETKKSFDIALIDKSLPVYKENSFLSGSDLVIFIREIMPNCKIIMITAHTECIIVYEIYKKVRPEGLILKNDITPDLLRQVVIKIMEGNTYQSPTAKDCIHEIMKQELMLDDYNRQILIYLSKGFKIRELEEVIFLTTSTIKKRIGKMKKVFETDDSGLIKEVIKQGLV